jgi:hypothetical protein
MRDYDKGKYSMVSFRVTSTQLNDIKKVDKSLDWLRRYALKRAKQTQKGVTP